MGRIKKDGYLIKQSTDGKGYSNAKVYDINNKRCTVRIHRLVAENFLKLDGIERNQVNHKDGKKPNNKLSNLEWVTNQENSIHANSMGLIKRNQGEKHHMSIYSESQIIEICKLVKKGYGNTEISRKVNFVINDPNYITKIKNGSVWKELSSNYL